MCCVCLFFVCVFFALDGAAVHLLNFLGLLCSCEMTLFKHVINGIKFGMEEIQQTNTQANIYLYISTIVLPVSFLHDPMAIFTKRNEKF